MCTHERWMNSTKPNQTKSSHVITLTNMITKWQKCTHENSTVYVCHTRTSTSTYPLPRRVPPRVAGDTGICWVTVTQRNTMWMNEWVRKRNYSHQRHRFVFIIINGYDLCLEICTTLLQMMLTLCFVRTRGYSVPLSCPT
jgi:hypothetical protein